MRRLAAILACASVAAACGGENPGSSPVTDPAPQPAKVEASAPANAPSPEQLAYREQLVHDIQEGTYVPCTCTAAIRAQDRIDSGKVEAPRRDQVP